MDKDAQSIYDCLNNNLRPMDKAHIISCGEIEDIIPANIFKNAINSEFKLQYKISVKDFDKTQPMVKNLHDIFKEKGFGEFKKAKVAQLIANTLRNGVTLSDELSQIIEEIKLL